jgi:PIN domain nuclease of toxin-antitoxin system
MPHRFLLDTHILIRWLFDVRRLTREQLRVLNTAAQRGEPVALSAMSLVEIAILWGDGRLTLKTSLQELFGELQTQPAFRILPLTFEIASEVASLGCLRDPADRTIVGTARVHRLRLVTSDQRIIESGLVPTIV